MALLFLYHYVESFFYFNKGGAFTFCTMDIGQKFDPLNLLNFSQTAYPFACKGRIETKQNWKMSGEMENAILRWYETRRWVHKIILKKYSEHDERLMPSAKQV